MIFGARKYYCTIKNSPVWVSFFNLARPMTHMTLTTPIIIARPQKHKMTVATCLSANGKPPSVIKWDTKLNGEAMFQETRNPNGTVTTRSSYVIVPSRECHRQKLTCIVTYNNEHFSDSVVLNVQCKYLINMEIKSICAISVQGMGTALAFSNKHTSELCKTICEEEGTSVEWPVQSMLQK